MKEKEIQKEILNAAMKVFIAKGKSGARMQEIADEAGVNKMLLHYYYHNKELLFLEVLKNVITDLYHSVIDMNDQKTDFQEILKDFIDHHFEFLFERRDILAFLLWEVSRDGRDALEAVKRTYPILGHNPFDTLAEKTRDAMVRGQIKTMDPSNFIYNLFSLDIAFFIGLPLIQQYADLQEEQIRNLMESRKQEIFRLLWNDIKPN